MSLALPQSFHNDFALRPLAEDQAEELYEVSDRNRAHLAPYLPWAETNTPADSVAFIRDCHVNREAGIELALGILVDDKIVGHISLMSIQPAHKAEIGYWLAREVNGRGIITRAAAVLVAYAFDELKLERLLLRCRTDNPRSRAVAQRLGFHLDGIDRRDDKRGENFYDIERHSLLRQEWNG
jgi:ribosomal-protein-serine acetyltransferase